MADNTIVKYVRGNLCSDGLTERTDEWALLWHNIAKTAKSEGKNLIVVEVPADLSWLQVSSAIEDMLEIVVTARQGKDKAIQETKDFLFSGETINTGKIESNVNE